MNELVKIPFGEAQRNGLVILEGVSESDWKTIGHNLCRCKDSLNFWIGDWLNYGNAAYGAKYAIAIDIFKDEGSAGYGLSEGTLRNFASVASRIQMSLRRDKLSWSHHVAVADHFKEDKDKDVWLAKAVMNKWSVAELTKEIREKQKSKAVIGMNSTHDTFMFDRWINDAIRGFSSYPVDQWKDDELLTRIRRIEEIEKPLLDEAKERGLEVV
jgi:hypothetical protein